MKLIDIMKAYNKAILRENAKLKSIYNNLIREAGKEEETDECDEAVMTGDDFSDMLKEDPESEEELEEGTVPGNKLITAKEFFAGINDDIKKNTGDIPLAEGDDGEELEEGDDEELEEGDDEELEEGDDEELEEGDDEELEEGDDGEELEEGDDGEELEEGDDEEGKGKGKGKGKGDDDSDDDGDDDDGDDDDEGDDSDGDDDEGDDEGGDEKETDEDEGMTPEEFFQGKSGK